MAQGVTENVKQAREQALTGCYDEAKVYYGGAIHGIQQLLKETQDPGMEEKWKQVHIGLADCIPPPKKRLLCCYSCFFCRLWACSMMKWGWCPL